MTSTQQAVAGIPNIVNRSLFYTIICVPKEYSPTQTINEAENLFPSGIDSKWKYYENGSAHLNGAEQNVQCAVSEMMKHVFLVA